ncbi:5-formyltetrahydrofolate cyclo-ligase [Natronospira sp.]|uniref:5-formyltetrahydrofolate cyclo-ligase n=1 Tax=Natronospira sp. TaxID=2024970 RepID=UPI0038738853
MASVRSLRRELKTRRRQLPQAQRAIMNHRLCRHLLGSSCFLRSHTVAAYIPFGGEPDLRPVLQAAAERGKQCFLPVVLPHENRLVFRRWQPGQTLISNRFGIPEPPPEAGECLVHGIDLVLTPLVAFDHEGNRVGMGAGFYDRSFAFRLLREHWPGPRLVGTAWAFQQQTKLPKQAWDIPLDAVITETGWQDFCQVEAATKQ